MGNFLATSIPSTPTATQNFQLTIVDEYNFIDSRKSYTLVLNGVSFTDYTITEPSQIVFNNVFSQVSGSISYSILEGTDTVYSSTINIQPGSTFTNFISEFSTSSAHSHQSPEFTIDTSGVITSFNIHSAIWSGSIKVYVSLFTPATGVFTTIEDGTWLTDNTGTSSTNKWRHVLMPRPITVAPGDKIQISHTSLDPSRLYTSAVNNGAIVRFTVENSANVINSPLDISGNCILWLDAADLSGSNGSSISTINDKSGSGNNATAFNNHNTVGTFPTVLSNGLNNRNIINFTGSNDYLKVNNNFNLYETTYVILVRVPFVPTTSNTRYGIMSTDNPGYHGYGIGFYGNSANSSLAYRFELLNNNSFSNTGVSIDTSGNTWYILTATYNGNNNYAMFTYNGNIVSPNVGTGSSVADNTDGLKIGIWNTLWAPNTSCHVAEVMLFNSCLTNNQRQSVEGYLANKWGLKRSLPVTHPFSIINVPDAPTNITASYLSGTTQASITFTPSVNNNGSQITSYIVTSNPGNLTSTINLQVNTSGLIAYYDPNNLASYTGIGNTLYSLVGTAHGTLNGTYSYTNNGIRLSNLTADRNLNVSHLQLPTLTNVRTISIWYQELTTNDTKYLLDSREGGPGGFIYDGGVGTNWDNGTIYKNGGSPISLSSATAWSNISSVGSWQNITLIASSSFTDDMNIFSRFSDNEAMNVIFGPILVYDRVLTESENLSNFLVFAQNYGFLNTLSTTVTGLSLGSTYTFTAKATNSVGTSSASTESNTISLATTPSAPNNVTAVGGNTIATVSWSPPTSNGGATITNYNISQVKTYRYFKWEILTIRGDTALQASEFRFYSDSSGLNSIPLSSYSITYGGGMNFNYGSERPENLFDGDVYTKMYTYNSYNYSTVSPKLWVAIDTGTNPIYPKSYSWFTANDFISRDPFSWNVYGSDDNTNWTLLDYQSISTTTERYTQAGLWALNLPSTLITTVGNVSSYMVSGLTNGTQYIYRVSAINSVGTGNSGESNIVIPGTIPGAPNNIALTRGNSQITVTWTVPTNNGGSTITGYRVERSLNNSTWTVDVSNNASTSYTSTGLTNGTLYYYRVYAINAYGIGTTPSTTASITAGVLPGAPTGLTASSIGTTSMLLSWTPPASTGTNAANVYYIYSSTDNITFTQNTTLTYWSAIEKTITGLTPSTTYYFRVTTGTAVGEGPVSNTITQATHGPPGVPSNVQVQAGSAQVNVSWTASTSNGSTPTYTIIRNPGNVQTTTSSTSATITGLTNGIAYTFTVSATNAFGTSSPATSSSVTPNFMWSSLVENTFNVSTKTVAVDSQGNIYNLLYREAPGTVVIRNADGTTYATITTTATCTFIILKQNQYGQVQWYTTIGENATSTLSGFVFDSSDNLYISAWTYGTSSTFNGTSGSPITITRPGINFYPYLAKYNSNGVVQYAFYPIYANGAIWGLCTYGTDVYITIDSPSSTYSILNSNGTSFRSGITANSPSVSWLIKYNASGNVVWATRMLVGGYSRGVSIEADTSGNIYVGGPMMTSSTTHTIYQVNGSTDQATSTNIVSSTQSDVFLIKYSSAGARIWSASINGAGNSDWPAILTVSATGVHVPITTNSSSLNILVNNTGSTSTVTDLSNNSAVVVKFLLDGTFSNSIKVVPNGGSVASFNTVKVDRNENIYVSGIFSSSTATLTDAMNNTTTLTRVGSLNDAFIACFTPAGMYNSVYRLNNTAIDGWWSYGAGLAVDSSNNLIFNQTIKGNSSTSYSVLNSDGTTGTSSTRTFTGYANLIGKIWPTVTSEPTSVSAVSGNGQAVVSWTAPSNNGGSSVRSYLVTSNPGGFTATSTTTSATVTGLTNGTSYTFTVRALNTAGTSAASVSSSEVTPSTVPDSPTNVVVTRGNGQATITWTAPSNNGGSTITGYTVTSNPDSLIATTDISTNTTTITGLTNGTSYTFTVVASNIRGDSLVATSNSVIPATTPGAPTNVTAVRGNGQAIVSWTAPASNGGLDISSYTVTSSPGGLTATVSGTTNATVTGLTNGTQYTFTVTAINAIGSSSASSSSNIIVPSSSTSTLISWSALSTGINNSIDQSTYTGTVRADSSGNRYTAQIIPGFDTNMTFQNFTFNVVNSDGTIFATITPSQPTIVIIKRNANGIVQWYTTVTSLTKLHTYAIDVDSSGNVYMVGLGWAAVQFNTTSGSPINVPFTSGGIMGYFGKWNSSGVIQYAYKPIVPTASGDTLFNNVRCSGSSIYLVGASSYGGNFNIVDLSGTVFRNIPSSRDNILIKVNANGTIAAAFQPVGTATAGLTNVEVDSSGFIYVTGYLGSGSTSYTAQNSNGSNETNSSYSITSSTQSDSFIVKYNSTFTAQWMVGIKSTNTIDVIWGLTLTPTGILVGMNNVGTESVTVDRHNGTLATLATITRPAFGSTIYSFDSNGALVWASGTTRASAAGSAYLESFTATQNGQIYITGNIFRATGVIYTSPSGVNTTISRIGAAGDAFVIHLNSSGQYVKHWNIKNIVPTGTPTGTDGALKHSTDIASSGSNLLLHMSGGNGIGLPSLKNFLNKTLVIAFRVTNNQLVRRIFDFNNGTSTDSYILLSGNQSSGNFFLSSRWFSSGSQANLISGVTLSTTKQYVTTFYIQDTTATLIIYSWNGTILSQEYTGTITYANGGGTLNPLNQLKCLWFGRSAYSSDGFLTGSYQKILSYDGQITTPSTTLPAIFNSAPVNTSSGSTYTFGAPTGFTSLSVQTYNNPTATGTEITLNGTNQYLAMNNLTILDEDRTIMYDTSNNTIAEFPATGQVTITGTQSLLALATIEPEPPTNLSTVAGNGQVTVSWTAPINNGAGVITSYTVTASPGGQTSTTSSTSATITDLSNGTTYTFSVVATNIIGSSSASTITGSPIGAPSAPFGVHAIASNASAILRWKAPLSNNGSAITSYTITSSPGAITTTSSNTFARISGLTNGTAYTFTVTATNSGGTSSASSASNSVTPSANLYMYFDSTHGSSYSGSGSTWSSLANSFNLTLYNTTYASNGLVFDGTSAYGGIAGSFSPSFPNSSLTIIYWINNNSSSESTLLTVNRTASNITDQFFLGTVRMFDHSTSFGFIQNPLGFSIPLNTVTQYVFRRNGTTGTFFTNGTTRQTIYSSQNVTYGSSDLYIGVNYRDFVGSPWFYNGSMYAIKIFNSVLSDAQILAEYNAGVTPSEPLNASATVNAGVANLSWSASTFTGFGQTPVYKVYDASTNTVLTTVTNGSNSASISLTSNNVLYVVASNTINSVEYQSAPVYFNITYSTPAAPLNPSIVASDSQIVLNWSDPSSNGGSTITGYRIERSTNGTTWTVDISNNPTKTYTATGLSNGTTYYFRISAINTNGFGTSSIVVTASPGTTPSQASPIIVTVSTNFIDISWNAPFNGGSPITGYLVESSTNGTTWTTVAASHPNTNYSFTGLTPGLRYFFRVSAINSTGTGIPSSVISGITISTPSTPVILSGVAGFNSATIIFDQSRNILPRIIQYRYTLDNGLTFVTRPIGQTLSPWFIPNLINGVTYQFRIAAYNANGWSSLSNMVSITPFDNRSTTFKNSISSLTKNNITTITKSILTELNSVTSDEARQLIFNMAQDISSQTNEVKKATLLSTTNKISSANNVIKSDINQQLVQLYGVTQNVPFDISDQTVVNQIIDVSSFKVPTWNPTNISVIVPDDENDVLVANLDLSNILLTTVPDKNYTFSATYNDISSINSYIINYKRTDASRYIIYDLSNYLYLGESLSFNFPGGITRNFTFNIFGNPGGEPITINTGGFGDPKIFTIDNKSYYLPQDENCYLLFNNMIQNERVVITAKCWFLPDSIKNNSYYKTSMMDNKTFFRYINIHYKGQNLTLDMETLKPVKYTNMSDVNNFNLQSTEEMPNNMEISEIYNDTLVFKNFYRNIKIKSNNVNFAGRSRIIKLGTDYEFKLSNDLNCVDHRNGILVKRANYTKAIGALIKESPEHVVENFNYQEEGCYLMYDNKRSERVRITAKGWQLPESVKQSSYFRNNVMENKEFTKYVNIHYMGENLTIDMETLNPVKYTNMKDLTLHKLESIEEIPENMKVSEIEDEQYVFKNLYRAIKIKSYNIEFNGKSRIIKLGDNYEIKLSMDDQCSDLRNSITFTKGLHLESSNMNKLVEKTNDFIIN